MIEQLWPHLKYMFGVIGLVAGVELYLSARWWPGYFMGGILLYRRNLTVEGDHSALPTPGQIESSLPDSGGRAPMLVRRIGEDHYAFREAMRHVDICYPPVMHGSIFFDRAKGEIRVRGYANSYVTLFSCFFLLAPLTVPLEPVDYIFPAFVFGLFVWVYSIQARRFRQVEAAVQKEWPRK